VVETIRTGYTCTMSTQRHTAELREGPDCVHTARELMRGALLEWGYGHCVDAGELATSELVTTALRHVGTPVRLSIEQCAEGVRVSVNDALPSCPDHAGQLSGPEDEGGRGLGIVNYLSKDWGCEEHGTHKQVWFVLDVDTADGIVGESSDATLRAPRRSRQTSTGLFDDAPRL